ncbi:alpha/beta hydrolase [Chlamydiifrater phoenicopteri]|uniref:alpha/beta hydrolase n=1 Tax=Chlamydiifrater phoenicopteri TaxID=2681469 RepID=UPI001BCAEF51|nr:alpha/beta hydrolase [Chlamydiifrater phoenicopteri]
MDYSFFRKQIADLDVIMCMGDAGAPVVVMCHGYGACADNFTFLPTSCLIEGVRPTWIFPNGIEAVSDIPSGRAWFPLDVKELDRVMNEYPEEESTECALDLLSCSDLSKAGRVLTGLIKELKSQYSTVIMGGFSQGAIMSAHVGLSAETPPDGLFLFSGAFLGNQKWETYAKTQTKKAPFFLTHGEYDEILPYKLGKRLYSLLNKNGFRGEMYSFPGGHEISQEVIRKMKDYILLWSNSK